MSSRSLEDDLLDIPGVEGAELDGAAASPAGLRIRIAEGADQRAVGGAIRRVLTKHGLGTDTRLPGEDATTDGPAADSVETHEAESRDLGDRPEPVASRAESAEDGSGDADREIEGADREIEDADREIEGAVSPVAVLTEAGVPEGDEALSRVIDLTDAPRRDDDHDDAEEVSGTRDDADPDSPGVEASPDPGSWSESQQPSDEPAPPTAVSTTLTEDVAETSSRQDHDVVVSRIDRVAVEEGRDGIVVTVSSTEGRSESQPASSTEGGVETAVVKAASRLAQPGAPDPTIIEIEDRRIKGVDIVMIVLDIDGTVSAGSAIVVAGRSFALGRATWAALSL